MKKSLCVVVLAVSFLGSAAAASSTVTGKVAIFNAAQVHLSSGVLTVPAGTATYTVGSTALPGSSSFVVTLPTGITFSSAPSVTASDASTITLVNTAIGSGTATFQLSAGGLASGATIKLDQFQISGATALATITPVAHALPLTMQAIGTDADPIVFPAFASDSGLSGEFVGAIQFIDISSPSDGTEFYESPDTLVAVISAIALQAETSDAGIPVLGSNGLTNTLNADDTATVTVYANFEGIASVFSDFDSDCKSPYLSGTVDSGSVTVPLVPINREVFFCVRGSGAVIHDNPSGLNPVVVTPGTSTDFLKITTSTNLDNEFPGNWCYYNPVTHVGGGFGSCAPTDFVYPNPTQTLSLAVSPQSVNVTYQQDAAFSGGTQTVNVSESGTGNTANWTATVSPAASWLSLSAAAGSVTSPETLTLNPAGLAPGVYTTNITFTARTSSVTVQPVSVPVTLTVLAPAAISVNPTAISAGANIGQTTPAVAPLTINTPGIAWSVQQAAPAQPWLTIGTGSGTAPSTVNLSMNPANLGTGRYYASLILTSPGAPNSPLTIPVQFSVSPGLLNTAPLVNGASFAPASDDAISPNELVSLFLPGISCPTTPAVTLNGVAAQVLGSANGQINAVLPSTVANGPLTVTCAGTQDWSFSGLNVVPALPGLFTTNFTGAGPGAILNQDGTVNSAANPAAPDSIVSVYGTGFGTYNPASADGLQRLSATVTATIGGLPATVIYAGQTPGTTLGLSQINVQLPAGVASGSAVPIVLTVGAGDTQATTQAGVTLAIQ